jgi:hypothetical protein
VPIELQAVCALLTVARREVENEVGRRLPLGEVKLSLSKAVVADRRRVLEVIAKRWRRGWESNPRMKALQTFAST